MTKTVILLAPLFLATTLGAASAEESARRVIRPADSVWDDAASLAANRGLPPTALRREAFQNPGVLDPRRLAQGFEEATRPLTKAGQEAGRYLEDGTRSLLEGTSNTLEQLDPTSNGYGQQQGYGGQEQAYGTRPNYSGNAAQQPQSALAENPRYAPPQQQQEYRAPAYDPTRDPNRNRVDNRGPALPQPNPEYREQRGLAEPFAGDNGNLVRGSNSRSEPIARQLTSSQPRDDRFDAFGGEQPSYAQETAGRDRTMGQDPSGYPAQQDNLRPRSGDGNFPPIQDRRPPSAWDNDVARAQSPNSTSADRFGLPRVDNTGFAAGGTNAGDIGVASWNGSAPGNPANDNPANANPANGNGTTNANMNQAGVMNAGNNSDWSMDRFMLVALSMICCYVVIAHLDLRNRYRAALRGAPAGYGNPLSEI